MATKRFVLARHAEVRKNVAGVRGSGGAALDRLTINGEELDSAAVAEQIVHEWGRALKELPREQWGDPSQIDFFVSEELRVFFAANATRRHIARLALERVHYPLRTSVMTMGELRRIHLPIITGRTLEENDQLAAFDAQWRAWERGEIEHPPAIPEHMRELCEPYDRFLLRTAQAAALVPYLSRGPIGVILGTNSACSGVKDAFVSTGYEAVDNQGLRTTIRYYELGRKAVEVYDVAYDPYEYPELHSSDTVVEPRIW